MLFKELKKLLIDFVKPYGIKDKLLDMPKEVKRMGYKKEFLSLIVTIFSLFFTFLLKFTNISIENKLFLLGIILFMLYKGERIIRDAFNIYEDSEALKFELIFDDEIVYKGSTIIGKTKDKVLKYDEKSNIYRVMSNESSLNTIKNYLRNYWNQQLRHIFDIYQIISIIIMIITAIMTNDIIPNYIFIPLVLIFSIINFLTSAYMNLNRNDYYKKHREYNNEQSIIVNDLLRVPTIVDRDLDMRINRFKNSIIRSNKNVKNFYKRQNISRFLFTILETLSQYGIIIFYVLNIKLNNLTLASIAEITATLAIVETAISHTRRLVYTLDSNSERIITLEKEQEDLKLILDTYHKILKEDTKERVVDSINIKPFTIKYIKNSDNDIPFTLKSNKSIKLNKGEICILYGASGSGKSTFMKMITEKIKLEKSINIPSTKRFLYYDEKLKFGSLSIYEELFCDEKNPDLNKMEEILKNLNLWYEIENTSHDVWQFMKEKQFEHYLSNGQRQRLILAKLLYFLDENIDALVLDECTSGLDDDNDYEVDAQDVLKYIVKYANKDRKRIIVISTHQNLDRFKDEMRKEFKIKNFEFVKENKFNLIKEI